MLKIVCVLLIVAGSGTMLTSIIIYSNTIKSYTHYLATGKRSLMNRYTFILVLMLFFLIGYIATLFYILSLDTIDMSLFLIVMIFFFGAVFCFSVVFVQAEFLTRLKQNALQLREALDESETANTALKELNNELVTTVKALEHAQSQLVFSEKMSALGKLMAGISHEINTPIGVVKASAQSLQASFSDHFAELFVEIRQLSEGDFKDYIYYTETAMANTRQFVSTTEIRALKRKAAKTLAEVEGFNDAVLDLLVGSCLLKEDMVNSFIPRLASESFVQILRLVNKTVSMISSIDYIGSSVEKVNKIVSSLKAFSHVNAVNKKFSFNILTGIETVLSINANLLKYDVEVVTDFDTVPPIMGYEDELCQVWNNLVQNAVYAMQDETDSAFTKPAPHRLAISVKNKDDKHITITISDNGCGISPDQAASIFDPFYTTKPTGIGSGLGLSISKQIIDKHEGTIEVESVKGQGTTFIITLPL